ncbi:hypothetical protein EJ08DRAFT_627776 [Tothia fuscella]|uniref:Zn(2)-C6 fungal-type domain-containing protein n=1 Tax=Tothia fuscella TaxID=1048955 RepID=A0A9P4NXK4_9PEZI|nr:hypothetical protein EJ08DRAFT_627776 [Tothia fuscella]
MLPDHSEPKKRRPQKRKSCIECIQAKRRCDCGGPACVRGVKQKLACRYVPSPSPAVQELSANNIASNEQLNNEFCWPTLFPELQRNDVALLEQYSSLENFENGSFDVFSGPHGMVGPNFNTSKFTLPSPVPYTPSQPAITASSSGLPGFAASRLDYGLEQLKLAPSTMVYKMETPWSHHLLYEEYMPQSMHDALGVCALYLTKNDMNSSFVFKHIELGVQKLLESPVPEKPIELLARVHALLLYQIIRVFDGDILARAQAERDISHLENMAYSLQSIANQQEALPPFLPLYPTETAKGLWKTWFLQESARRTFLICFFYLALYCLVKGKKSFCQDNTALPSTFTASSHLWHARSVLDFAIAWKERHHFVITDLSYDELRKVGTPEDIETFGKILLVSDMGIDDTKGWLYTRNGCF